MRLVQFRLTGDKQDIYINVDHVICVFAARSENDEGGDVFDVGENASNTRTTIVLIDDTIVNVEGGLKSVIARLQYSK